jgi:hypothetical protein
MPSLHVKAKLVGNRFAIGGGGPGGEVSWQITGTRKDAYARMNPVIVEEEKGTGTATTLKKGEYLHPEAFGLPAPGKTSAKTAASK